MKTILILLAISLLSFSCSHNSQNKNNFEEQPLTLQMDSIIADTNRVLIAELPIYFDSTDFIIHPIGFINNNNRNSKLLVSRYSGGGYSDVELYVGRNREDSYTGNITNLIFENIETRNQHLLTTQALNINSINYLRDISKVIKRHYILYIVEDQDINHDGFLDNEDNKSLFISKVDGTSFIKITNANEEYFDGELLVKDLKYYFRSTEEKKLNESKLKTKVYHYYFIDFSKDPYVVTQYNPLGKLIK
jgi:hypothetical protein